jgi:PAS domain S-box-containing protein
VRELTVPIQRDGLIVAVLGVGNKAQAYTEKDTDLVAYFADVAWEIAQRKQAEEALKESEGVKSELFEKLNEAQQIAMMGNWEWNLQTDHVWWSDETYRIFGVTPQDFVPSFEASGQFIHPDDFARYDQSFKHALQTGEPLDVELRLITNAGRLKHCQAKGKIIYDEAGQLLRFIGTVMDITERKRTEEVLTRRAVQVALLSDIGRQIAAILSLDQVLDRAAHLVQESFDYHHVALFLMDHERGEFVMKAIAGNFIQLFPLDHRIQLEAGMVGWVGAHGARLVANDVRTEPHYINFYPDVIPTCSELSVPIRLGEETVGVLDVQSPAFDDFDENDVKVIETLADQIAAAIANARLYEAAQQARGTSAA